MLNQKQIGLIALLLALAFGLAWFDVQSSQYAASYQKQNGSPDKSNDEPTKIGADERIANYTWWLALLTGALVAVSLGQGFFLLRSDKTARMAALAALKSAETAEKDLLASHKPLVTIINLELCEPNATSDRHHISFGLRNSGKGLAVVNKIGITVQTVDRNQQQRSSFTSSDWNGAIESGESSDEHHIVTTLVGLHEWQQIREGSLALFVNFEILGKDIFKNDTRQVFPFVYNPRSFRFERAPSQWTKEQERSSEKHGN